METCREVSPDRKGGCFGDSGNNRQNAQESSSSRRSTGMHKKQNRFVCFQMATVAAGTREVQGSALLGHRNRWLFTARMLLLPLLFSFNSLVRAQKITFALKHPWKLPWENTFFFVFCFLPFHLKKLWWRCGKIRHMFLGYNLSRSLFFLFFLCCCLPGCLCLSGFFFPSFSPLLSFNHLVLTVPSCQNRYAGPGVGNQRVRRVCVSV